MFATENPLNQTHSWNVFASSPRKKITPTTFISVANCLESLVPVLSGIALAKITNEYDRIDVLLLSITSVMASIIYFFVLNKIHEPLDDLIFSSVLYRLAHRMIYISLSLGAGYFFTYVIWSSQNYVGIDTNICLLLLIWTLLSIIMETMLYLFISYLRKYWHNQGAFVQVIAIVGAGTHADRLVSWLKVAYPASIEVMGVFEDRRRERAAELPLGHLVRGTIDDLLLEYRGRHIDRVLVALPHAAEERLLHILRKLRPLPADITLAPDVVAFSAIEESGQNARVLPLLDVYARPLKAGERLAKAIVDRVVAASLVVFLLPIFLIISVAIALESRGPILFKQPRYGLGHCIITVLKFRTMYSELSDYRCVRQTEINDTRTTRVGRWLRRTSLDELPQLFNVLRGDMSLVGPRPLAIEMRVEDKLNQDLVSEYSLRHRIKPGITGWAQIQGLRGSIHSREGLQCRVENDLYYIDNWSFWLDIKIIFLTGIAIFKAENAY